jgi:hypothetical protein
MNIKFGKTYENDYGSTTYSNKFTLNGTFDKNIKEKFGKKTIRFELTLEDDGAFLNDNGIKIYDNSFGFYCYIQLKDNEIPDGNDFVIKRFTNKNGKVFCSLVPSSF